MSLLFDRFPTREHAERFVEAVHAKCGLRGQVYDSQAEMHAAFFAEGGPRGGGIADYFPFEMEGVISAVERSDDYGTERAVERMAPDFGGVFAGT